MERFEAAGLPPSASPRSSLVGTDARQGGRITQASLKGSPYIKRLLLGGDDVLRLGLVVGRQLAEHLGTNREDEGEAIVPLHPADWNADEVAALIENAAARYARVTVGETRHQTVRRFLSDVAGRQDDALRVVVAQPEDRIGELVCERRVHAQRRELEIARLDDRPIAAVHFHFSIAGVDDLRRNLLAVIHDL